MKTKIESLFKITRPPKIKVERSWRYVKNILKAGGYPVDLRKASKNNIPLSIVCNCKHKGTVNVRRIKDFPLKNLKCKCGRLIIEWKD